MPDHVHLFVALSNMISLGQLMRDVKGASSRSVSESLQPGRWCAWQPNDGAFGASARDQKSVIPYIESHKQHHTQGIYSAEAQERFEEEDV